MPSDLNPTERKRFLEPFSLPGTVFSPLEMIGHQVDAEDFDRVLCFCGGEQLAEGGVVAVLVKGNGLAVAAIEHMVGVSSNLTARKARHGVRTVRQAGRAMQE